MTATLSRRGAQFLILEIALGYGRGRISKFNVLGKHRGEGVTAFP